ncbi:MAG: MFS transporter, partial [Clostridia bacterium]|nr:MFS transporter [Clostridia bacterium]
LTGFGISTVYPNLMHITQRLFGKDISQSVMGTNLAAACLGILLAPAMFGLIAQWIGVSLFPYYLAVMFALLLVSSAVTLKPKTGE